VLPAQLSGLGLVPLGPGIVPVASRYGACFCRPGTKVIEQYECRDTNLIGG